MIIICLYQLQCLFIFLCSGIPGILVVGMLRSGFSFGFEIAENQQFFKVRKANA